MSEGWRNRSLLGRGSESTINDTDRELVKQCLEGRAESWAALIDRYHHLIYSIPIKCGFSADDACDIFQEIGLRLLYELPRLNDNASVSGWLIKTTYQRCCQRLSGEDWRDDRFDGRSPVNTEQFQRIVREVRQEQALRDSIDQSSQSCRNLIESLFQRNPGISYAQAARDLCGLKGAVGLLRMNCLRNLRTQLEEIGFQ